jgi:hypothetical protein
MFEIDGYYPSISMEKRRKTTKTRERIASL